MSGLREMGTRLEKMNFRLVSFVVQASTFAGRTSLTCAHDPAASPS